MYIVVSAIFGFLLDLLLGDPAWMPHPVIWMGRCITKIELTLRGVFPKTAKGALWAGVILAISLPLGTLTVSCMALAICNKIHPYLGFLLSVMWCWQSMAVRGLYDESMNVHHNLTKDSLENARKAVSRIVGRDTAQLSGKGVIRATVETVAENFSDGVVAPMCYMLLGGAPLALCYKAVNTMDSMVGYKNETYLYFGRAAAKLDDGANYLPSRLAAGILVVAAGLCKHNLKASFDIWRRDRRNHASPNSAQTEAAMAGALGIQLAGPTSYFGCVMDKPWIGDGLRPTEPEDIVRANRIMVTASVLCLLFLATIRAGICLIW